MLLALLGGSPVLASTHAEPTVSELVVEAPMLSEDEVPPEQVPSDNGAVDRQDNLNKAIIVAIAIAAGSLVASFGALICCCCFYMGYYY